MRCQERAMLYQLYQTFDAVCDPKCFLAKTQKKLRYIDERRYQENWVTNRIDNDLFQTRPFNTQQEEV